MSESIENSDIVDNWNDSYVELDTTYSETPDSPSNLSCYMQFESVLSDIKECLPDRNELKVLECGCGGARTALFLASKEYDVTCSDYADEAIRLARSNFEKLGLKGKFLKDNLLDSKIPQESFDCVMSFGLLEHFEDLTPVVSAVTKMLKPGGIHIHNIIPKKFSTQTIVDVVLYPFRFVKRLIKGDLKDIFSCSFRDFPHYENSFSAYEYCRVFESQGNDIIKCEARSIIYPFIALPLGIGRLLVRNFTGTLISLIHKTNNHDNRLMHFIAPTFYLVCRKASMERKDHA